jgi:glycosyltransferase involved in cell wall biosynthesis
MKVLALVDSPDHVCCRYRIRAFEPALNAAGWSLTCQPLAKGTLARVAQFARGATYDSVILQRKLLPAWQFALLRRSARHLVFDFDDAVLLRDSYDRRGPYSSRREHRFATTVRAADAVIAGNDFLADCALRAGSPPQRVRTIPTCIDPGRYPRQDARQAVPRSGPSRVDLVWIGSSSTLQGLQQQEPLWNRLGREIPGLRLRVICDRFPSFPTLPVVPIPWAEEWEAHDLAAGHIGISWLPNDPWSRGKCGLKILQYQAARLPVVANPVGIQSELIEPGATGFLPETPEKWVEAIRTLAADIELRQGMGRLARQRVESGFSIGAWAVAFVSAVAGTDRSTDLEIAPAPGTSRGTIPGPFFLRMHRARVFERSSSASHFDGNPDHH